LFLSAKKIDTPEGISYTAATQRECPSDPVFPLCDLFRPGGSLKMNEENTNLYHVACAIIERDGLVLAAQRSRTMRMPLQWEFPGGKIEPGEGPEACLHRELLEELGIRVSVKRVMPTLTHRYPAFTVMLHPFVCELLSGELVLNEHRAIVWLKPGELPALNWVEADFAIIAAYRRERQDAGDPSPDC
jgi:8-oxo-dGTP diphosphatase